MNTYPGHTIPQLLAELTELARMTTSHCCDLEVTLRDRALKGGSLHGVIEEHLSGWARAIMDAAAKGMFSQALRLEYPSSTELTSKDLRVLLEKQITNLFGGSGIRVLQFANWKDQPSEVTILVTWSLILVPLTPN